MAPIERHPAIFWSGFLGGLVTLIGSCVALYLYLENLDRKTNTLHDDFSHSIQAKEQLDDEWIKLDRADHANMIHLATEIRRDIKRLEERLKIDSVLLYQIGLRDGKALCEGP